MNPSFESFLEPGGIIVAAGIITSVIQLLKNVFPALNERISGAVLAFLFSAIIYVLTAISVGANELNEGLTVFAAWLACATAAVGVYETVTHVASSQKTP